MIASNEKEPKVAKTWYMISELFGEKPIKISTNNEEAFNAGGEIFHTETIQDYPSVTDVVNSNADEKRRCIVSFNAKGQPEISYCGYTYTVEIFSENEFRLREILLSSPERQTKSVKVMAPMPGLIKSVEIAEGDIVKKGSLICTLEAMKMENAIKAPQSGVVRLVGISQGKAVEKGTLLCEIAP